jgi:hypothetical protein
MIRIFTRGPDGTRPVYGTRRKFQEDPYWRDLILFHEYFDGDTGEGLGASHQTGWTGLVASLIDEWRRPRQASSRLDGPSPAGRGRARPRLRARTARPDEELRLAQDDGDGVRPDLSPASRRR